MKLACAICRELVPEDLADAHLASRHPTPPEGFAFFYNGHRFQSDRPSMLVLQLLALVGGTEPSYQFYEDRSPADRDVPLSHGNAVDLTNGPRRFYSIPPARM